MFRPDSPFVIFLTRAFNFVAANFLFLLTSIPIITIGASWSALYRVISNLVDDSSTSLGIYFETFRAKFKMSTMIWAPCAVLFFLLMTEVLFISNTVGTEIALPSGGAVQMILIVLAVLVFSILSYVFPLIGMNDMTLKQILGISFYLAMSNFFSTVVMTVINLAPVLGFFLFPELAVGLLPLWLLAFFSAVTWLDCKLIKKALKKLSSEY